MLGPGKMSGNSVWPWEEKSSLPRWYHCAFAGHLFVLDRSGRSYIKFENSSYFSKRAIINI